MATQTPNYGLVKPDQTEVYDIAVPNANMDKIDTQMKANDTKAQGALDEAVKKPTIHKGVTDPTPAISGAQGDLYLNTVSKQTFICASAGTTFDWVPINKDDSAEWGKITGTLSLQADLQGVLDTKITAAYVESLMDKNTIAYDDNAHLPTSKAVRAKLATKSDIITLNNDVKTEGEAIAFYAPVTGGSVGQVLMSGGEGVAPQWGSGGGGSGDGNVKLCGYITSAALDTLLGYSDYDAWVVTDQRTFDGKAYPPMTSFIRYSDAWRPMSTDMDRFEQVAYKVKRDDTLITDDVHYPTTSLMAKQVGTRIPNPAQIGLTGDTLMLNDSYEPIWKSFDSALSTTSINAPQAKAVKAATDAIDAKIGTDTTANTVLGRIKALETLMDGDYRG